MEVAHQRGRLKESVYVVYHLCEIWMKEVHIVLKLVPFFFECME
jgi:hypothetical protein